MKIKKNAFNTMIIVTLLISIVISNLSLLDKETVANYPYNNIDSTTLRIIYETAYYRGMQFGALEIILYGSVEPERTQYYVDYHFNEFYTE